MPWAKQLATLRLAFRLTHLELTRFTEMEPRPHEYEYCPEWVAES
jgi:hypothetical protein